MRVLLCNKFYYRRGGDCTYTIALEELLRRHGHDVAVFAMEHPETLETPWRRYFPSEVNLDSPKSEMRFLARSLGYGEIASKFKALLKDFKPDVVHLNNIHSQLSPVIAEISHRSGCRVVWTMHDYKLLCPRYDCLRRGEKICELCFTNKINVLKYRCMKNSLSGSIMAFWEAEKWNRKRLEECTDAFICPSDFMRNKMAQGGFDQAKLHHLCNFIDAGKCVRKDYASRGDYYCYVGRISHEKGLDTLVEVANRLPYKLVVVGDGPLIDRLPVSDRIEYVGRKDWPEIKEIVGNARFMVIPSEWYENNPLSVIESLCLGTPVLGSRIGGIPELIEEGINGLCFESGNKEDLASKIETMSGMEFDYAGIASGAQSRFSEEAYYEELIRIIQ